MASAPAIGHSTPEYRPPVNSVTMSLANANLMPQLTGAMDRNLLRIEKRLKVSIGQRGTDFQIEGANAEDAADVLRALYRDLECGVDISENQIDKQIAEIHGAVRGHEPLDEVADSNVVPHVQIKTRKKTIIARNTAQANYMLAMQREEMVFGLGPAGTGKTYLAVAQALAKLANNEVDRLILSRPAVEAGEKLGFLPGDMKDKVDPYLRPIYDALYDCLPPEQVERNIASGIIEVAPIAFMRGRTLANAFIILDEAQNTTPEQMKMFLTRFGEGSQMVICGDPRQTDLPGGMRNSGLTDAVNRLEGVEGIAMSRFTTQDVVRHAIVGRIVSAYEDGDANN